jgi:hypothetical protein
MGRYAIFEGTISMKTHSVRARIIVTTAAGLSLTMMSPAWADCCSSILGCVATYVTDGLSCEVETLIDTLNAIGTGITNFINDVDGQTQAALQTTIQSVDDSYNQMQSQSQQSDADLATALSQAKALYQQETAIKYDSAHSVAPQQIGLASSGSGSSTATSPRPPVEARAGAAQGGNAGLPLEMTTQSNPTVTPVGGAPNNPLSQKSAVDAGLHANIAPVLATNTPGTFADAFSRAIEQIQTLKTAGDADLNQVNSYLQKAKSSETSGIAAANQVQNFMNAPLTVMQSEVSEMLSHPWTAFDPSSVVDSIEAKIGADLTANINQMIGDITTDADADFNAAQPSYDDLLARAQAAQVLETAMANAYQQRTPAAANALYAALPQRHFQNTDAQNIAGSALAANNNTAKFGQRLPYSVIAARISTAQQRARSSFKKPSVDQIHLAVVKFKSERAQGKTLPQSTLALYKSKLAQQLDNQFNGKSSAAILSERDQLVAQARTKFAGDPNTANAVVGLLNSEATKRAGVLGKTTPNPEVPGQPVTPSNVSRSVVPSNPAVGLTAPVSALSQSSPVSGLGATSNPGTAPAALGSRTLGTAAPAAATTWSQPTALTARPVNGVTTLANPTVPGQPVAPVAPQRSAVWGTAPPQNWAVSAAPNPPVTTAPIATVTPVTPVTTGTPVAPVRSAAPIVAPALNSAVRVQSVAPVKVQQPTQIQTAPQATP